LQVAQVDRDAETLPGDEHGIAPVQRIDKQHERAGDAQVPERHRNHAAAVALAGQPLDDEPAHEQGLPGEAQQQPRVVVSHRSVSSAPAGRARPGRRVPGRSSTASTAATPR
jgi:hypothetical protein